MKEIEICAYLSDRAYGDHIELEGHNSTFISNKGAQAHIVWSSSAIYVAFRGTSEAEDIIKDMKFWRKNGVHIGFLEQFKDLEDMVNTALKSLLHHSDRVLVFTGHSLGGSLALLAAEASPYRNRVYRVFTFGAVSPGGRSFRKRYGLLKHVTWNVITLGDPVPRLFLFRSTPGRKLLIGYRVFVKDPSTFRLWRELARNINSDEHSISTYFKYIKLNWGNICRNH